MDSSDKNHTDSLSRRANAAGSTPSDESQAEYEEDSYDDIHDLSADFRTVTLAELYIEQGHLEMAADVLEEILRRDETNRRASELLRIVNAKRSGAFPGRKPQSIVAELTRWMKNIDRMRSHAG